MHKTPEICYPLTKLFWFWESAPSIRAPAKSEPWDSIQGTVHERQVLGQTRVWLRDGVTDVMAKPSESPTPST